jgi:hypothetical protein
MTDINYEAEVLKVYPDAEVRAIHRYRYNFKNYTTEYTGKSIYYVHVVDKWFPQADTKELAWQTAYNNLKQQGKL